MVTRSIDLIARASLFASALVVLAPGDSLAQSRLDEPTESAWPVDRAWDATAEHEYSEFVAAIGRGAVARRCRSLAGCLNHPEVNPLFEPGARRQLRFRADCADVPYILRAYFAYRRHLPFAWAERMRSERAPGRRGRRARRRDVRYLARARPDGLRTFRDFATPRALIQHINSEVHSGYFRMAPGVETADSYPVRVERGPIRPGTVYYDPNGHVLVVYAIEPNGDVRLFDGHPDNSLTTRTFSDRLAVGGTEQGGGFRNFRPVVLRDGHIEQVSNAMLTDFDPVSQALGTRHRVGGRWVGYHGWVRAQLAVDLRAVTAQR